MNFSFLYFLTHAFSKSIWHKSYSSHIQNLPRYPTNYTVWFILVKNSSRSIIRIYVSILWCFNSTPPPFDFNYTSLSSLYPNKFVFSPVARFLQYLPPKIRLQFNKWTIHIAISRYRNSLVSNGFLFRMFV